MQCFRLDKTDSFASALFLEQTVHESNVPQNIKAFCLRRNACLHNRNSRLLVCFMESFRLISPMIVHCKCSGQSVRLAKAAEGVSVNRSRRRVEGVRNHARSGMPLRPPNLCRLGQSVAGSLDRFVRWLDYIASNRRIRSSMGGWVEKRLAIEPPLSGFTMYICAEAGLTSIGCCAL